MKVGLSQPDVVSVGYTCTLRSNSIRMDDSGVCLDRSAKVDHNDDSNMTILASPMLETSLRATPLERPNKVRRLSPCSPAVPIKKRRHNKQLTYHTLLPHSPPSLPSHAHLALSLTEPMTNRESDTNLDEELMDPGFIPYELDTYMHRRRTELKYHPVHSLKCQSEVTSSMREVMVEWMIQIIEQFTYTDTTLFLAVNILDRFLRIVPIAKDIFQLSCVTAIFIAAKQEEQYPPEISALQDLCQNCYTREQVIQLERIILRKLKFDLLPPTSYFFMEHSITQRLRTAHLAVTFTIHQVRQCRELCKCLLKKCLVDYDLSQYTPSLLALSSLEAADRLLHQCTRLGPLEAEGYSLSDVSSCVSKLHKMALVQRLRELRE